MTKANEPPYTQKFDHGSQTFVNADGTTIKDIYDPGLEDVIVTSLSIVSDDTAALNAALYLNDGTTDYQVGLIPVPAGSGTDGTNPAINGLSAAVLPFLSSDSASNPVLKIKSTWKLRAALSVAATTGKTVTVVATIEDFEAA